MSTYGYLRKNYPDKTTNQLETLLEYDCQDLFIDDEDFNLDKEQLLLMSVLKKKDTLIIYSFESFVKTFDDLQKFFNTFALKKIRVVSIKENIDTNKDYFFSEILDVICSVNKKINGNRIKQKLIILKE